LEEDPNTINDDFFLVKPDTSGVWSDMPAAYHAKSCAFLFSDGHSTFRKWTDTTVINQLTIGSPANGVADLAWVQSGASYHR
jgi:hypothetical protein